MYFPHDLQFKDNGLFKFTSLNIQLIARTEKHLHHNKRYSPYANTEKPKKLITKQKKKILEEGRREGKAGLPHGTK